jgi:hypothetical protein
MEVRLQLGERTNRIGRPAILDNVEIVGCEIHNARAVEAGEHLGHSIRAVWSNRTQLWPEGISMTWSGMWRRKMASVCLIPFPVVLWQIEKGSRANSTIAAPSVSGHGKHSVDGVVSSVIFDIIVSR